MNEQGCQISQNFHIIEISWIIYITKNKTDIAITDYNL